MLVSTVSWGSRKPQLALSPHPYLLIPLCFFPAG